MANFLFFFFFGESTFDLGVLSLCLGVLTFDLEASAFNRLFSA
jgi:hypothetical protein